MASLYICHLVDAVICDCRHPIADVHVPTLRTIFLLQHFRPALRPLHIVKISGGARLTTFAVSGIPVGKMDGFPGVESGALLEFCLKIYTTYS